jgi:lysozyme
VSSLKGHPEIKVFKAPEIYPIFGYDLSSADGRIDWRTYEKEQGQRSRKARFIYARAAGWSGPDKTFEDRWAHAAALGLDRGAYIKFDFCATPDAQLEQLKKLAPPDPAMLPVSIELVTPEPSTSAAQTICWNRLTPAGAKDAILQLAQSIEAAYGKTPILAGNRYNLGLLADDRSDRFMLWLYAYGSQAGALRVSGRNPWTLWQYSGAVTVQGIGPETTAEVFFGSEQQYQDFKAGRGNIGLQAVQ